MRSCLVDFLGRGFRLVVSGLWFRSIPDLDGSY